MKRIFYLVFIAVVFFSCNSDNDLLIIEGNLKNCKDSTIYIVKIENKKYVPFDSTKVDSVGNFRLSAPNIEKDYYLFGIKNTNQIIEIIAGSGQKIVITGNAKDLFNSMVIEGSEETAQIVKLYSRYFKKQNEIRALGQKLRLDIKEYPDSINALRSAFNVKADSILGEQREYLLKFIDNNQASLSALSALAQVKNPGRSIIEYSEYKQVYQKLDSVLSIKYPKSYRVKELHNFIKRKEIELKSIEMTKLGAIAPNLSLPDEKGNDISLSSHKGKFVLVYFWDSSCRPCKSELPNVIKAYQKYEAKGLVIYNVSLDISPDAWSEAITDEMKSWINVCDFKGMQSPAALLYNIKRLPDNYLLDRNGKIIAKNMRGNMLEIKLAQHIP